MTYQEFRDSVLQYMGHWPDPDPAFDAALDVLIEKAEAKVHTLLRHPFMLSGPFLSALSVGGDPPYLVPDDFLEPHSLISGEGPLEYRPVSGYIEAKQCDPNDRVYSIIGREIIINPADDGTAVFSYYARPPSIQSNPNGALFVAFPHLYHSAACTESARFLREPPEVLAAHQADFERYLADVTLAAWSADIPKRQPLKVRTR
jgi:hypothetical protein